MFTGTYTAIVTPFRNGKIDEKALEHLIRIQVRAGVDGIVPVGTTGESPTVDYDEHVRIIELSVKLAGGKIKAVEVASPISIEYAPSGNYRPRVHTLSLTGIRRVLP